MLAAHPNLLGIYIEILVNMGYFYKRYPRGFNIESAIHSLVFWFLVFALCLFSVGHALV